MMDIALLFFVALLLHVLCVSSTRNPGVSELQNLVDNFGSVPIKTLQTQYGYVDTINITVGNNNVVVRIDTTSADLWIDSSLEIQDLTSIATHIPATVPLDDGSQVTGEVVYGDVSIGRFEGMQAFLFGPGNDNIGRRIQGSLGIGLFSNVQKALQDNTHTNTLPVLYNIFNKQITDNNNPTVKLQHFRHSGHLFIGDSRVDQQLGGDFEVVPFKTWGIPVDGVIVNGVKLTGASAFNLTTQDTNWSANLKSGLTSSFVPRQVADFIYSQFHRANLLNDGRTWTVSCAEKINVSFVIGNQIFPIHPIDLTFPTFNGPKGKIICQNTFVPTDDENILGDSFLRNAHVLFNFGLLNQPDVPSVRLFPITDPVKAFKEFRTLSDKRNAQLQLQGKLISTNKFEDDLSMNGDLPTSNKVGRSVETSTPLLFLVLAAAQAALFW